MFSAFVIVTGVMAVMLALQYITIPDLSASYAVRCHQHYPDIEQSTLYDFVMLSDAANKWMKFVTFVATDHKPVGIGKMYKVAIGAQTFSFVTIEHQQGHYLILQSINKNDVLNLRVEIRFTTVSCVPVQFEEENLDILSSYPFSTVESSTSGEKYGTNASEMEGSFNNNAPEVQYEQQRGELFSTGKCGSELSFNIFSLHNSLLFQVITNTSLSNPLWNANFTISILLFPSQNSIGIMFRYFLSLRLEHSLSNLAHIFLHVEG
ncbi:uncharacterized protein LOC128303124 [Anopheles moucheti]|uniref:uncharacterized protein LOC128303124 n=1 Tax=Anopheles moucheti TaxID=186751 RepID=UPI0022F10813|nr:uncharacterized protein LOC128303124 [Anopheles moucheti]